MDSWKKLKRVEGGIERICHYQKSGQFEPLCYGCVHRGKCNADIFERLAEYEDTGLTPEQVSRFADLESVLKSEGMTLEEALKTIKSKHKGE